MEFKYKYLKRLFFEALGLSVISFLASVIWSIRWKNPQVTFVLIAVCLLSAVASLFVFMYSRLFVSMESAMNTADQKFMVLRKRHRHYTIYGTTVFINCFSELAGKKNEITHKEYDELMSNILSSPQTDHNGDECYHVTNCEGKEMWLRIKYLNGEASTVISDISDMYLQHVYLMETAYFDSKSRLLNREAFFAKVQHFFDDGCSIGYYAMLAVNGIEKSLTEQADGINVLLERIGLEFKALESNRLVIGKTSRNKFIIFFAGYNDDLTHELNHIINVARNEIDKLYSGGRSRLTVSCGCCCYPDHASTLSELSARAEFALYEATQQNATSAVVFSKKNFEALEKEFQKAKAVHEVLDTNNIDYHYQPIVSAKDGKIFAYEALMRPISLFELSPLDMLEIATKDNCLLSIERLTMHNVLSKIEENYQFLKDKKLFINSIPNALIPKDEFDALIKSYGPLLKSAVIEITEEENYDNDALREFQDRYIPHNCQIAIDDFGVGYSNESNLLKYQPAYIKIDRELISELDKNDKKKHLVENTVNFAKKHNIKVIAEGVTNEKELGAAIAVNVDYIQGHFTGMPRPEMIDEISKDVIDLIVSYNLKRIGKELTNIYETHSSDEINIVDLALEGYGSILIKHSPITLVGDTSREVTINVLTQDNLDAVVTFNNCSLSKNPFVFRAGENSRSTIVFKGKNSFKGGGFEVSTNSELIISGDGDCNVITDSKNPVAFGNKFEEGFGKLTFNSTGKIEITTNGDNCIAIGGGFGGNNSEINILSGTITINQQSLSSIAIGSMSGNAIILISHANMNITSNGDNVLCIGSVHGIPDIELSSSVINISASGDMCTGVGCVSGINGCINVTDKCTLNIDIKAKCIVAVGGHESSLEIFCNDSTVDIHEEGMQAIGFGDADGSSIIQIKNNSIIYCHILSVAPKALTTSRGQIYIDSGNIIFNSDITGVINSRGVELRYYRIRTEKTIFIDNYDNGDSGCYVAPVYTKAPRYIGVCVPEGFLPPDLLMLSDK